MKKKKNSDSTVNKPRTRNPRKLDTRQRRAIVKESSKNHFVSARALDTDVASTPRSIFTPQAIRNILHDSNIRERTPDFLSDVLENL